MQQKAPIPTTGDIIIHKHHASGDVYMLGLFNRAARLTYEAYAQAMKRATEFAVEDGVDAWYTEDGETYRSLARHRRRRRQEDESARES